MARRSSVTVPEPDTAVGLHHVLVVGGTVQQWASMSARSWARRRIDLAKSVAHAGASWLTLRPYEIDPRVALDSGTPLLERSVEACEGCTVIVDPSADGRERILAAIARCRAQHLSRVDEATLTALLVEPAPREPDLTIVLGSVNRLPPSLVWELAYSEIVFIDTPWDDLSGVQIERATDEFSRRHRRFGGLQ